MSASNEISKGKLLNIGIFAHVDAGKTTLSEAMLYHAHAIRALGSVDSGTAHTDTLPIERQRGISVRSAATAFEYNGRMVALIDTPGHADFSFEIERALWALDCAVLILSAVEGVQAQTELIFDALRQAHIPTLIFINKTDRIGADANAALGMLRRVSGAAAYMFGSDELCEEVCQSDEGLMEAYLDGSLSDDEYNTALKRMVAECEVYPAFCGSALRDEGITDFMRHMTELLPAPYGCDSSPLSGVVFGLADDKVMGQGALVRIFDGSITVRQELNGQKITQLRVLRPDGWRECQSVSAGEIAQLYGISELKLGQTIGEKPPRAAHAGRLRQPLVMVELQTEPAAMQKLRACVRELERADPLLEANWSQYLQKLHIMAMGTMQLDVLQAEFAARDLNVTFGEPQVMYRETIATPSTGFVAYTMPKPCWAVIKLMIEPLPRGSGVMFESIVPDRQIKTRYQHQIEQALPVALKQGMLGWPVTDIKLTLIDGNDHQWHTHPLDFVLATPMAVMDGLQRAGSVLLEPIMRVRFTLPSAAIGGLISDIAQLRGSMISVQSDDEIVTAVATIPAKTLMSYSDRFAQLTGGRGIMAAQLDGYEECDLSLGAICLRRSVNPLDTSKYILAARSALDGGVWDGGW